MNKESYAALTPSQRAAFDKLTGQALSLKGAKAFDDWSDEAFKAAREGKKVEVIQLAPDRAQGDVRCRPAGRPKDARRTREGRHQGRQGGLRRDQQVHE